MNGAIRISEEDLRACARENWNPEITFRGPKVFIVYQQSLTDASGNVLGLAVARMTGNREFGQIVRFDRRMISIKGADRTARTVLREDFRLLLLVLSGSVFRPAL